MCEWLLLMFGTDRRILYTKIRRIDDVVRVAEEEKEIFADRANNNEAFVQPNEFQVSCDYDFIIWCSLAHLTSTLASGSARSLPV